MKLSARNQLAGTVTSINAGEAIANVAVDVAGQRLVSSITVEAVRSSASLRGSAVTVIIKASDVDSGDRVWGLAASARQVGTNASASSAPRYAVRTTAASGVATWKLKLSSR